MLDALANNPLLQLLLLAMAQRGSRPITLAQLLALQ